MPTECSIARFAAALADLRESVGGPSFREMARRSGCISHTALYEASRGTKMPSWTTTREFVLACGAEPEQWEPQWAEVTEERLTKTTPDAQGQAEDEPGNRRPAVVAAATVASAVVAIVAVHSLGASGNAERGTTVPMEPYVPGDSEMFVRDITLPDGAVIVRGQATVKVWELENTGTITWQGRYLQLEDPQGACTGPDRAPIEVTHPRDRIKVSVPITAGPTSAECMVHWQMRDADGSVSFPGNRSFYYQVSVR